jgi:hypothetical protein
MKLREWTEEIAALGVMLSLLFVGFEIRQNTRVARGQTLQALAEINQQWLVLRSTDTAFNELWLRYWEFDAEVSELEAYQARWAMRLNVRRLENVYLQYAQGLVDQTVLNSYGLRNDDYWHSDRFRSFWTDSRSGYDPAFVAFFEEIIEWGQ